MIGKSIANRPYMYLPLKGDTNDYSTNAQNPSNTGVTTTTGQFGESNGAYEWANVTDRLEFTQTIGNDFASYINGSGAMLFCFIKVNNGALSSLRSLFNQFESGGTNRAFNIQFAGESGSDEDMYCSLYPGGSGFNWNGFYSLDTSDFKNVCYKLVKNGSNVDGVAFVDAVSVGTTSSLNVPKEDSTLNTRIGAITGNSRGDLGEMHTFRIYDVILSDGALKILNNEKGRIRT